MLFSSLARDYLRLRPSSDLPAVHCWKVRVKPRAADVTAKKEHLVSAVLRSRKRREGSKTVESAKKLPRSPRERRRKGVALVVSVTCRFYRPRRTMKRRCQLTSRSSGNDPCEHRRPHTCEKVFFADHTTTCVGKTREGIAAYD